MNYVPIIIEKLREFSKECPDYSFGDLLYSVLRQSCLESKPSNIDTKWLRQIKDEDFYTSLERNIEFEKESNQES